MPGNVPNNVDWNEIKQLYDAGNSYRGISRQLAERGIKVSHVAISKRAIKENWEDETGNQRPVTWKPDTSALLTVESVSDCPDKSSRQIVSSGLRTEGTLGAILGNIAQGMSPSNAAATAGIAVQTFSNWRKDDPELDEQIRQARQAYLGTRERNVHQAGNRGDLRANLAVLERSPETAEYWQPKSPAGQGQGGLTVNISIGDPKQPEMITITPGEPTDAS